MGHAFTAICNDCSASFTIHDGPGMRAMPFHCDTCGKEWWWDFGPGGPIGEEPTPPPCDCGGKFRSDAPPRCSKCCSTSYTRDPQGETALYD